MRLSDGTILSAAFGSEPLDLNQRGSSGRQSKLKIGTIIAVRYVDSKEGLQMSKVQDSTGKEYATAYETVYDVKIDDMMSRPFMCVGCRVLKPFYGPNNYFEVIHESADLSTTYTQNTSLTQESDSLAGSRCVLLFLEGEASAPVILGFLNHLARPSKVTNAQGVHLGFEFNGINVTIDKDGAFTLLASGPLLPPASIPYTPLPELDVRLDPINGPLTISIDKQFNFSLLDIVGQTISITHSSPLAGAIEIGNGDDSVLIEKAAAGGTITITSSKALAESCIEYTLDATSSIDMTTKTFTIGADVSAEITTGNFKVDASIGLDLKTPQMKIECQATFALKTTTMSFKGGTGELLSIINDLFTGLGGCTVASPVGPCAPLQGAPQWPATVQMALVKLQGLMG